MSKEKSLADKVIYSIHVGDDANIEKFYIDYLRYTRDVLKTFDMELQNRIVNSYAKYQKKKFDEKW